MFFDPAEAYDQGFINEMIAEQAYAAFAESAQDACDLADYGVESVADEDARKNTPLA